MVPKGIIIHHSLTKDGKVADYEAIRRYHMKEKGWNDIGYHFIIELDGTGVITKTGRSTNVTGAHCVGKNNHIGICVVGNYDIGKEVFGTAHMDALVALTVSMLTIHKLPVSSIHKHSEYAPKTCPGSGFPWELFISKVEAAI